MRVFIIMVTFDTPVYIQLFQFVFLNRSGSLYLALFNRSVCISFSECYKDDFTPRKKCHRIDNANMKSF